MTMQAQISLGANKTQVTFNAGAFVDPVSTQMAIYVNLVAGDAYRDVDVANAIENLMEYARETAAQFEPLVAPIFFRVPIGAGKGAVNNQPNVASIAPGMIGIGIGPNVPLTSSGPIQVMLGYVRDSMWDQDRVYA